MKKLLYLIVLVLFVYGCQQVPEPADKSYYISTTEYDNGKQTGACSFRYKIENSFDKLDNALQQNAIRAAFDLWQNANPNILFLQKQDGLVTELYIRFDSLQKSTNPVQKSTIGLIRGDLETLSALQQINDSTIITLNSDFGWDTRSLTRVVAFHVGKFLGVRNSEEKNSMLNPVYTNQRARLSEADSIELKRLYNKPCKGDCNDFLPLSFDLATIYTKSVRIDKPGKITVTASGSMIVGRSLGWSTPNGLSKGLFNIPIGDLSIERAYNHAALIYKINSEPNWRVCNSQCEFETDGVSQCVDVTFAVNDLIIDDNIGSYQVAVDFKK